MTWCAYFETEYDRRRTCSDLRDEEYPLDCGHHADIVREIIAAAEVAA